LNISERANYQGLTNQSSNIKMSDNNKFDKFTYTAGHLSVTFNQFCGDFNYSIKGVKVTTGEYNTRKFNELPEVVQVLISGRNFRREFHIWASARSLPNNLEKILSDVADAKAYKDKLTAEAVAYAAKVAKESEELRILGMAVKKFISDPRPSRIDGLIAAFKNHSTTKVVWSQQYAGGPFTSLRSIECATLAEVVEFKHRHAKVIADFDQLVATISEFAGVQLQYLLNGGHHGYYEMGLHYKNVVLAVPCWVHPTYREELCNAAAARYEKLHLVEAECVAKPKSSIWTKFAAYIRAAITK
jgi:hypothetical protein